MVPLSELPHRAQQVLTEGARLFYAYDPLVPRAAKALLVLVLALCLVLVVRQLGGGKSRSKWRHCGAAALAVVAALVGLFGVLIPAGSWYPNPRVVSGIALFWSAVVLLAFDLSGPRARWRPALLGVTIALLAGFTGMSNQIFSDRYRNNLKDHSLINRIVGRLEARSDFPSIRRVAMRGALRAPLEIPTQSWDLNASALKASWARIPLIREVTGHRFAEPTPEDTEALNRWCARGVRWPHPESITVHDGCALICVTDEGPGA